MIDYNRGKVNDAMTEAGSDFPIDHIVSTIDDIYERSLALLKDAQDQGVGAEHEAAPEAHEEVA